MLVSERATHAGAADRSAAGAQKRTACCSHCRPAWTSHSHMADTSQPLTKALGLCLCLCLCLGQGTTTESSTHCSRTTTAGGQSVGREFLAKGESLRFEVCV